LPGRRRSYPLQAEGCRQKTRTHVPTTSWQRRDVHQCDRFEAPPPRNNPSSSVDHGSRHPLACCHARRVMSGHSRWQRRRWARRLRLPADRHRAPAGWPGRSQSLQRPLRRETQIVPLEQRPEPLPPAAHAAASECASQRGTPPPQSRQEEAITTAAFITGYRRIAPDSAPQWDGAGCRGALPAVPACAEVRA